MTKPEEDEYITKEGEGGRTPTQPEVNSTIVPLTAAELQQIHAQSEKELWVAPWVDRKIRRWSK